MCEETFFCRDGQGGGRPKFIKTERKMLQFYKIGIKLSRERTGGEQREGEQNDNTGPPCSGGLSQLL